jgi:hypothetical protein
MAACADINRVGSRVLPDDENGTKFRKYDFLNKKGEWKE